MDERDDPYAALGVAPDATTPDIEAAWRFTLQAFHPDKFRDPAQQARAEGITKSANAAWQLLRDDETRRRHDHLREQRPAAQPSLRSIPCPSCATPGQVPDHGGATVELVCPACRITFTAMVGAICVVRPTLERRGWWGLRYVVGFREPTGEDTFLEFRSFPKELALTQGERFSVVFDPVRGRPVYAVNHAPAVDLAWRVA